VSKPARMKAPISGSSCCLVSGLPAGQHITHVGNAV
jgi:hypothetical protein